MSDNPNHLLEAELTADIVSAFVSNNPIAADQLSELIRTVHGALGSVSGGAVEAELEALEPAVSIKKSLKKDHLVCLDCGKSFKSIKRHLGTSHDLTPDAYREKWGLKPDYPMVAPAYAEARSKIANEIGLGRKSAA